MPFVGRESEITRIEIALDSERNAILFGKYGIGRTALVREIARRNAQWRFIFTDFEHAGGTATTAVLSQLLGRSPHVLHELKTARQIARSVAAYVPPKRIRRVVIVLDNVVRLTRPKINLLKLLRESAHLAFVAILERFVSDRDLMRMRVALDPAVVLTIEALDLETSVRFFAAAAADFRLPWTESDVELLARTMHGYPLEMARTVSAARRRLGGARP